MHSHTKHTLKDRHLLNDVYTAMQLHWHSFIPSHGEQCRQSNLCDRYNLFKIIPLPIRDIPGIMVHWVHNGTIALENLRGWKAVGNEALVIGAASCSLPNNKLWRIELGKVTNQIACFGKVYATGRGISRILILRE